MRSKIISTLKGLEVFWQIVSALIVLVAIIIMVQFFWFVFYFFFSFLFFFFRAAPKAHGSSWAKGQIGAIAAGHTRAELHLQPTPQFPAMQDP